VLAVTWKADKSTIVATFLIVFAGWGRIAFARDFVLGGALIALGIILAVRTFFSFRTPGG
jgi:F0F1-type ATP synthase assembly protein I